ncbi:MAG: VOC family protein [Paracoccaceae bacterium]
MKNKISLITLGVADVARALKFYHDGLGSPLHNPTEDDDHPMLIMEGSWLALYAKETLAEGANVPVNTAEFSGVIFAHNVASKAEVDAVYKLAIEVCGMPMREPEEAFWGGYSAHFADPDGYVWSATYNPFTDLS